MFVIGSNSASTGYTLTRSLRLRASASGYLSRTPATTTNRKVWTWSGWVKRGILGANLSLFSVDNNSASNAYISMLLNSGDEFQIFEFDGSAYTYRLATNAVFRDPSGWYHFVCAVDTDQGTNTNRIKLYVNGVQLTSLRLTDYPTSGLTTYANTAGNLHAISATVGATTSPERYFDGYLAEVNFIDGQQLTPSSFGSTNAATGVWQPAAYTGSYGTNGFYLTYNDPTSALTLGYDAIPATRITSGSGNYTIPAYSSSLVVECWGAGGGGAGTSSGGVAPTAGTGGATTFSTLTANGGIGGTGGYDSVVNGSGGAGGTASGGDVNTTGNAGVAAFTTGNQAGANGVGGGGLGGLTNTAASTVGPSGGGGNGGNPSTAGGGGGGSGGYTKKTYAPGAISGSIAYSVGTGGTAGSATSYIGYAGANGGIRITVDGVRVDNDWYPRGISVAAGVTYDSMTDVPTLTSATAANFAVLNPLDVNSNITVSGGNLNAISDATAAWRSGAMTFGNFTTGKWYYEITANSIGASTYVSAGWELTTFNHTSQTGGVGAAAGNNFGVLINNALRQTKVNSTTFSSDANANSNGDILMIAVDFDAGKGWVGKNGTWYDSGNPSAGTSPCTTTVSGGMTPAYQAYNAGSLSFNAGQRAFSYTAPTGFVALNTYNLPTSTIVKGNTVMDATLWAGDNTARSITNAAAFKPDLVWIKDRTTAGIWHVWFDSVRGVGNQLSSNQTDAELASASNVAGKVSAFNSNGFSVVTGSSSYYSVNQTAENYVGWQWQAGQGTSSSNTNGSITSTVSVNASAGFSVVTYTGTNTATNTVGHGLGVTPAIWLIKNRTTAGGNWVYNYIYSGAVNYAFLNSTNAGAAQGSPWSTLPTSSVITLGGSDTNTCAAGNNYVMYAWTPIAGFSAFGSYSGNNSTDGPMVYTGFQPKFVLIKGTGNASGWQLQDSARNTYNVVNAVLRPDLSAAESTGYGGVLDFLSNGFKLRTTDTNYNSSSYGPYIYMAFATNPFKNSLGF